MAMTRLLNDVARRCPGGRLPDHCLYMDTETSGTDFYKDRALQYGFAMVVNRVVVNRFSQLVKRPGLFIHPDAQRVHGIGQEKLAAEGADPHVFIPGIVTMLEDWRKDGHMFGGHNIMKFDAPMFELDAHIHGRDFKFGDNEVIDTGMLVKAAQLGMFMNDTDSLRSFYLRVAEVRARGTYWSLDRYCFEKYNLGARCGIDKTQAHDAEIDCVLSNGVFDCLRELLEKGGSA